MESRVAMLKSPADRMDTILKADVDPQHGWAAVSLLEEKQRQSKSGNAEKEKLFAECLKSIQDKKNKEKTDAKDAKPGHPFPRGPGRAPGTYANFQGIVFVGQDCFSEYTLTCLRYSV